MAELADAADSKSADPCGHGGSTPPPGTNKTNSLDGIGLSKSERPKSFGGCSDGCWLRQTSAEKKKAYGMDALSNFAESIGFESPIRQMANAHSKIFLGLSRLFESLVFTFLRVEFLPL